MSLMHEYCGTRSVVLITSATGHWYCCDVTVCISRYYSCRQSRAKHLRCVRIFVPHLRRHYTPNLVKVIKAVASTNGVSTFTPEHHSSSKSTVYQFNVTEAFNKKPASTHSLFTLLASTKSLSVSYRGGRQQQNYFNDQPADNWKCHLGNNNIPYVGDCGRDCSIQRESMASRKHNNSTDDSG